MDKVTPNTQSNKKQKTNDKDEEMEIEPREREYNLRRIDVARARETNHNYREGSRAGRRERGRNRTNRL